MKGKITSSELKVEFGDFVPPSIDEFIQHDLWTVIEAAFVLTEWPKDGLFITYISFQDLLDPSILENKPYFVLPEKPFYLKKYSKSFQEIYQAILEDINNGLLKFKHSFFYAGNNYLISPFEVILWAIKCKFRIPIDLQNALSIRLKHQRQTEPWRKKVDVMIVKQYTTLLQSEMSPKKILESQLMQTYVSQSGKVNQDRQLKRDISSVSIKRNPGWQKDKMHKSKEPLIIIPEVLSKSENYFECDFVLLKEVIMTSVFIKSHDVLGMDNILKMSLSEFMLTMIKDKIIRLYLKETPGIIVKFIEKTIVEIFEQFQQLFKYENHPI